MTCCAAGYAIAGTMRGAVLPLAMLVQHWLLVGCAWGDRRCSLHKAGVTIREVATHLARSPEPIWWSVRRVWRQWLSRCWRACH